MLHASQDEMFGLNMLEVNSTGKIQRMVTFHAFSHAEELEYVNEAYQRPITKTEE